MTDNIGGSSFGINAEDNRLQPVFEILAVGLKERIPELYPFSCCGRNQQG